MRLFCRQRCRPFWQACSARRHHCLLPPRSVSCCCTHGFWLKSRAAPSDTVEARMRSSSGTMPVAAKPTNFNRGQNHFSVSAMSSAVSATPLNPPVAAGIGGVTSRSSHTLSESVELLASESSSAAAAAVGRLPPSSHHVSTLQVGVGAGGRVGAADVDKKAQRLLQVICHHFHQIFSFTTTTTTIITSTSTATNIIILTSFSSARCARVR